MGESVDLIDVVGGIVEANNSGVQSGKIHVFAQTDSQNGLVIVSLDLGTVRAQWGEEERIMSWITGLGGGVLGLVLGCLMSLWAANQWASFDDRLLILAGLMPLFGFMA